MDDKGRKETYCSLYTLLYLLNFEPCAYITYQKIKKIKAEMSIIYLYIYIYYFNFQPKKKKKADSQLIFKQNSLRVFQTLILDIDYITDKTFSFTSAGWKDADPSLNLFFF